MLARQASRRFVNCGVTTRSSGQQRKKRPWKWGPQIWDGRHQLASSAVPSQKNSANGAILFDCLSSRTRQEVVAKVSRKVCPKARAGLPDLACSCMAWRGSAWTWLIEVRGLAKRSVDLRAGLSQGYSITMMVWGCAGNVVFVDESEVWEPGSAFFLSLRTRWVWGPRSAARRITI